MKIYITTNGCEVGQLYSMHVQQFFMKNIPELIVTEDPREADLIVLYGCGLTEAKERNSLFIAKKLKSMMNPSARLIVWGCLSKQNPKALAKSYGGPIIGPSDMGFFEELLEKTIERPCIFPMKIADANIPLSPAPETYKLRGRLSRPRERVRKFNIVNDYILPTVNWYSSRLVNRNTQPIFYIRVAEGCTSHCTYCSERLVWGPVKSRSIEKIMSEFQKGLKNGYTRFFLCAEDLGAYGTDTGHTASDLLNKLVNFDSEKEYKIIINEMSPPYLKTAFSDFKEILATGKIESVGCQVESGSSRILKLMGRNYSAEEWRKCMLYINTNFPKVGLTTHFMVGFPTETNEDFEATLKLLDYPLFLKEIAIFKFSASWRVPASRLPKQVPETIKELRYRKLQSKFLHMYTLNTVIGYCGSIIRSLRLQAH
jgi:tRNA A37 methylthiotransferase MiaB